MSENIEPIETEEDLYADWIAVGGGNYTTGADLLNNGFNQAQVDYLCSLNVKSCVIGMLINEMGYGVHFDCHPDDFDLFERRYVDELRKLGYIEELEALATENDNAKLG